MAETPRETRRSARTNKGQLTTPGQDEGAETPESRKRLRGAALKTSNEGKSAIGSAKSGRDKSAGKRRPGRPRKQTPEPVEAVEELEADEDIPEPLPHKIVDGEPLPTLRAPQTLEPLPADYQKIPESGVLASSLKRSRDNWINGLHFTKHYAKTIPKKPKDRTAEDKEQILRDKQLLKNMTKIGDAQLTIDPHIFKILLYMTREIPQPQPNKQHQQTYHPQQQPWGMSPTTPYPQAYHAPPPKQYQPPLTTPKYNGSNAHSQTPYSNSQPPTPTYQQPYTPGPKSVPASTSKPKPRPTPTPTPQRANPVQPSPTAQAAPDPVIHMLAQRAGVDPELKKIMKTVAGGKASAEELEYFQGHINQLTAILEKQNKAAAANQAKKQAASQIKVRSHTPPLQSPATLSMPTHPQSQTFKQPAYRPPSQLPISSQPTMAGAEPPPAVSTVNGAQPLKSPAAETGKYGSSSSVPAASSNAGPLRGAAPYSGQVPSPSTPHMGSHGSGPAPGMVPQPQTHMYPPYSPAPLQPPRPIFKPIYFEFAEGPGDRLVFPENSILEYSPGSRQMRFSFLVIKDSPIPKSISKKPSQTTATATATTTPIEPTLEDSSASAEPKKQYYQCVTGSLVFEHPNTLDCLTRAVKPPDEVRKYMENVFDTMERADERYLALILPTQSEMNKTIEAQEAEKENDVPSLDAASAAKKRKLLK